MANFDNADGFRPTLGVGGSGAHLIREFDVAAGYGVVIGKHGLVMMNAGSIERANAVPGSADEMIVGSAVHDVQATAVARKILVYCDPLQLFEVQTDDGNTITTAAGFVGKSYEIILGGIDANTQQSTSEINEDTAAGPASTTLWLHCVGISPRQGNDVATEFTRVLVQIVPEVHLYGMALPVSS